MSRLQAWLFGGQSIPARHALFALDAYKGQTVADLFGEVAPAYSEARRAIAERVGLGRGRRARGEGAAMSSTAEAGRSPDVETTGASAAGSAPSALGRLSGLRSRRKLSIAI